MAIAGRRKAATDFMNGSKTKIQYWIIFLQCNFKGDLYQKIYAYFSPWLLLVLEKIWQFTLISQTNTTFNLFDFKETPGVWKPIRTHFNLLSDINAPANQQDHRTHSQVGFHSKLKYWLHIYLTHNMTSDTLWLFFFLGRHTCFVSFYWLPAVQPTTWSLLLRNSPHTEKERGSIVTTVGKLPREQKGPFVSPLDKKRGCAITWNTPCLGCTPNRP